MDELYQERSEAKTEDEIKFQELAVHLQNETKSSSIFIVSICKDENKRLKSMTFAKTGGMEAIQLLGIIEKLKEMILNDLVKNFADSLKETHEIRTEDGTEQETKKEI